VWSSSSIWPASIGNLAGLSPRRRRPGHHGRAGHGGLDSFAGRSRRAARLRRPYERGRARSLSLARARDRCAPGSRARRNADLRCLSRRPASRPGAWRACDAQPGAGSRAAGCGSHRCRQHRPAVCRWPRRAAVAQWHSDTFALPDGATLLATSPACRHQAFRFGAHAYGLQFHPEVTADMVAEWAEVPEYADAMRRMSNAPKGGPFAGVPAQASALAARARQLYHNFTAMVGRPA